MKSRLETNAILLPLQGVGVDVGEASVKIAGTVMPEAWLGAAICREAIFALFGAAMASKIAETEIRVTERLIRSAEARSEIFCRFLIVPAVEHRWPCYDRRREG